jgi:hypothetical protein
MGLNVEPPYRSLAFAPNFDTSGLGLMPLYTS